ncbi:MAG TPA: lysine-sensitive aspartokinase 3 [Pyrinomonadaceae bacterium]|nr:lysine-sensitive aspartokinase 3 [Pyrinomonadaceae bacterium]
METSDRPTIMKFGGTSVEDAGAFERVAGIVESRLESRPVVVVSAMSRFTDALLQSVERAADGDAEGATRSLDAQFERHTEVARGLSDRKRRDAAWSAIETAKRETNELLRIVAQHPVTRPPLQDEIVSYGERLSALLLASLLSSRRLARAQYVDARRCIVTDDDYGNASPIYEETETRTRSELLPLINSSVVPVMGGFIASSLKNATTTLGRGGSDYTAALVGASTDAREIEIWTDVTGVLTADPRVVESARTIRLLSYSEAAELAYFGAKVLHPKTIQPAVERRIPVRICNSRAPEEAGTLVRSETEAAPRTVKAIAHKTSITTVQITSGRMLGAYGFLHAIFEIFDRHRTAVDVVTTSEVSVSLSLDDASGLPAILEELKRLGEVEVIAGRAIVCVVGEGLRSTPGIASRVFSTISDINVSLVSQGASSINLTFAVEEAHVREVVTRLHRAFFEQESEGESGSVKLASKGRAR